MFSSLKDEYQLIRECICGQIYDSSPVDFTAELATRFLHHTSQRLFSPTRITSWMTKVLTSSLDAVFLSRFEAQRAEYWQSLYSSVVMIYFFMFKSFLLHPTKFVDFMWHFHSHLFGFDMPAEYGPFSYILFGGWWPCLLPNNLQFFPTSERAWWWC